MLCLHFDLAELFTLNFGCAKCVVFAPSVWNDKYLNHFKSTGFTNSVCVPSKAKDYAIWLYNSAYLVEVFCSPRCLCVLCGYGYPYSLVALFNLP